MTTGGFGVTFQINSVTVVDLIDITWPTLGNVLVDVTAHDSTGGWREHIKTGLREHSTFVATLGFVDTETSHGNLLTAFDNSASDPYTLISPDSSETLDFNAHIMTMERVSEKDGYYQMNVTFQPTGQPTLT